MFGQGDDSPCKGIEFTHTPIFTLVLNWQHVQCHHVRCVVRKSGVNFGVPAIFALFCSL